MKEIFSDLPSSIENTNEIVSKIEAFDLTNEVLLPKFEIPEEFIDPKDIDDDGKRGENNYLRHLTYIGAKKRYDEVGKELKERIDFELDTIKNTGYPGYFLIVEDFIRKARDCLLYTSPSPRD